MDAINLTQYDLFHVFAVFFSAGLCQILIIILIISTQLHINIQISDPI